MSAAPAAPDRRPSVGVYPDGPLIVRGDVRVVDDEGRTIEVRRRTFALCRCGRSRTGPLCDGTHAAAGFRADSASG